ILAHIDGAESERRRLAQRFDRENLAFVPAARERHHLLAGERARNGSECALLLAKIEIHGVSYRRISRGATGMRHRAPRRTRTLPGTARTKRLEHRRWSSLDP